MNARGVVCVVMWALVGCATANSTNGVQRTTVLETEERQDEEAEAKAEAAKMEVVKQSQILKMIGTVGSDSESTLVDVLSSGNSLDTQLSGVGGLVGAKGMQVGAGGMGMRGAGIGGGGSAQGLGGIGTTGLANKGQKRLVLRTKLKQDLAQLVGKGKLDESMVRAVMRRHARSFKYCVEKDERKSLKPGTVATYTTSIQLEIDQNGRVTQVKVLKGDVKAEPKGCIVRRIKRMRFPMPEGGAVKATVDMAFEVEHLKDTSP